MSLTVQELCPKCGANMYTYTNQGNSTSGECIIKTICSHCGYEKPDLGWATYCTPTSGYSISSINDDLLMPRTIEIGGCERIILKDKSLDFSFEIYKGKIEDFDEIVINGIKFVKEN